MLHKVLYLQAHENRFFRINKAGKELITTISQKKYFISFTSLKSPALSTHDVTASEPL